MSRARMYVRNWPGSSSRRDWTTDIWPPAHKDVTVNPQVELLQVAQNVRVQLMLTLDFSHGNKLDDVACPNPASRALQPLAVICVQDLPHRNVNYRGM
jgi:hypothetical protein